MKRLLLLVLILTAIPCSVWAFIDVSPTNGEVTTTNQNITIKVNTDEDPVYAVFFYDSANISLWVKIIGQKGNALGEYDLGKGNVIELQGKGNFALELYSTSGTGSWESEFLNKTDMESKYPSAIEK